MNPAILVEVLSEATEEYDRGDKFTLYKSIAALQHYILISQTEVLVDHFERIAADEWECHQLRDRTQTIHITEPALSISLSDIFSRVV